ncbi:MAG: hypothetical protein WBF81_06100, partial [Thermoplasmata archaeon]
LRRENRGRGQRDQCRREIPRYSGLGLNGVEVALALLHAFPLAAALTVYVVSILVDCAFLWGLVGSLTYVYTGKYHLLWLGAFYSGFYALVLYWSFSQRPSAVILAAGSPTLAFSVPANVGLSLAVVVGLLGPEIAGAILYLSLLRQTKDRTIRYRIRLVGSSILLWFALDVFVPSSTSSWALARDILQVIPGLLSLVALIPPAWVRRRLDLRPTDRPEEYYRERPAQP